MSYSKDALTDIATALAHEIKNPVALILVNTGILKMLDTSNTYTKYYATIERESHRISDLANSLMNLTVGSERFSQIDMDDLIEELVDDRNEDYSGSPTIDLRTDDKEHMVLGDRLSLELMLSNLIKNAKEAIDSAAEVRKEHEGKIIIRVSHEAGFLRILVDDNGIGLPDPEKLRQGSYTTKPSGSGMGLRICRSIVERHEGHLELSQKEAEGCIAEVRIPLA